MIKKETFRFLKELKKNNNREWFNENRDFYMDVRKDFEGFIENLITGISKFDPSSITTPKEAVFRIHNDLRFSKNKPPYKTNFGAYITGMGRKGVTAGYYVHVEPGECFLAGGIYMPPPEVLRAVRTEIFENFDEFESIINGPEFIANFGKNLWGEKLKSAPRGFPADFRGIEYLKYKHYSISKDMEDSLVTSPSYLEEAVKTFRSMLPFNAFINRAINENS
jgi:uncharacterized protein (TIGR02453 family)